MGKIGQYNAGSVFPTMGRLTQVSETVTLPSVTLSQDQDTHISKDITIGSGQLTNITIEIDGVTYPLDVLSFMDNDWDLEIWCERKAATTITVTIYLWKHSAGTATHSAVSVKVALNAFDLP